MAGFSTRATFDQAAMMAMPRRELPRKDELTTLYATPHEPCPYLPDRMERKLLTPLIGSEAATRYESLTRLGFRRSQTFAYRPACPGCDACVPVRVRVAEFQPSRNFRKLLRACADWREHELPPVALPEHYRLFYRYQSSRHGGEMARMSFGDYRAMIEESFVDTHVRELRTDDDTLCGITIYDRLSDSLSGLYQFFDPDQARASPGTFMILRLIEQAKAERLPFVYLGYWVQASRKMAYKARFQPLDALQPDGSWKPLRLTPD
jgi:arginine-tRNA-protein transferase